MIVLADTHALIWLLTDPGQLSTPAREQLNAAAADPAGGVLVSVASRIDMHYVAKKGTFSAEFLNTVWQVVHDPERNVQAVPVTASITTASAIQPSSARR